MDRRAQQLEHAMTFLIMGTVSLGFLESIALIVHAGITGGHTLPLGTGGPRVGTERATHEISQFRYDLLAHHEIITAWLCPATAACAIVGILVIGVLRVENLNAKALIWKWRATTLRRDRCAAIQDHALGALVFCLLACFGFMVVASCYLSGFTGKGKSENGRYFLEDHSRYSEVSRTEYQLATILEWVGCGSLLALLFFLTIAIVRSIRRNGIYGLRR